MIVEEFQFYSDYFAYVAEAGLERARSVFPGISAANSIDKMTIVNQRNRDSAVANLRRAFDTAYEYLWLDGQDRIPLQESFLALSQYVLEKDGSDVNSFLTDNGLQVEPLYATLANIYGEEIGADNIKSG